MSAVTYDSTGTRREFWDDDARTYTAWNAQGVQTEQRPFTEAEEAAADVRSAEAAQIAEADLEVQTREAFYQATVAMQAPPVSGADWVQPSDVQTSYAIDSTVKHGGKNWVSLTPFNVWEPGVSGWREVVSTGYPAWVQPTGGHDAYNVGDRVTHNAQNWESNTPANVWEPGVFGWVTIP